MWLKPICVACKLFYKPEKNGFVFEEGFGDGTGRPYKLWVGDKWKCRGCGSEIIVGTGEGPIMHHHELDYAETRRRANPELLVDDC